MKKLDFTHDCFKYNFRPLQTTEIKSYRMRLIIYRHLSQMPSFSSSFKIKYASVPPEIWRFLFLRVKRIIEQHFWSVLQSFKAMPLTTTLFVSFHKTALLKEQINCDKAKVLPVICILVVKRYVCVAHGLISCPFLSTN